MPASLPELLRLPKRRRWEITERLWASVSDEQKMPVPAEPHAIIGAASNAPF